MSKKSKVQDPEAETIKDGEVIDATPEQGDAGDTATEEPEISEEERLTRN